MKTKKQIISGLSTTICEDYVVVYRTNANGAMEFISVPFMGSYKNKDDAFADQSSYLKKYLNATDVSLKEIDTSQYGMTEDIELISVSFKLIPDDFEPIIVEQLLSFLIYP